jgi:hypothetical protein
MTDKGEKPNICFSESSTSENFCRKISDADVKIELQCDVNEMPPLTTSKGSRKLKKSTKIDNLAAFIDEAGFSDESIDDGKCILYKNTFCLNVIILFCHLLF